jgi:hypothetical protein
MITPGYHSCFTSSHSAVIYDLISKIFHYNEQYQFVTFYNGDEK